MESSDEIISVMITEVGNLQWPNTVDSGSTLPKHLYIYIGGVCGAIVNVVGNEHGDLSS